MKQIWIGKVDDKTVRIMQIADGCDCIVEELVPPCKWVASDDETASHTYMVAFLEFRDGMLEIQKQILVLDPLFNRHL